MKRNKIHRAFHEIRSDIMDLSLRGCPLSLFVSIDVPRPKTKRGASIAIYVRPEITCHRWDFQLQGWKHAEEIIRHVRKTSDIKVRHLFITEYFAEFNTSQSALTILDYLKGKVLEQS